MFSNTLGNNTEIVARFSSGHDILEIRKTDIDTWLFVVWEQRGEERINRKAMILQGEQLRAMVEHQYLFTKG